MDRRALLTSHIGGAILLFAGCAGDSNRTDPENGGDVGTPPVAELEMEPVTDVEVARRTTYRIDLAHRATEREFAASVLDDGSETITATNPPVPENRPFVYEGSVFELSYVVTDSDPSSEFRFTLSEAGTESDGDETIAYDDLPEVDKTKLKRYGWEDGGPFESAGVAIVYSNDAISESVLVPEPEYDVIEWDSGAHARISVEQSGNTELTTYEYTSRLIHESAREFGRDIREEYEFTHTDLTDEQQTIISEAIESENGYEITGGEPPKAFERLADRFSRADRVPTDGGVTDGGVTRTDGTASGSYVVRYEGTVYWTRLLI